MKPTTGPPSGIVAPGFVLWLKEATHMNRRYAHFAFVLLLAGSIAGCREETIGFTVVNDLDQSVKVSRVVDGVEESLERSPGGDVLEPGQERAFHLNHIWDPIRESYCQEVEVIARTQAEEVVAVVPSPICLHDRISLSTVAR